MVLNPLGQSFFIPTSCRLGTIVYQHDFYALLYKVFSPFKTAPLRPKNYQPVLKFRLPTFPSSLVVYLTKEKLPLNLQNVLVQDMNETVACDVQSFNVVFIVVLLLFYCRLLSLRI